LCVVGEGDAVEDGGINSVEFAMLFAKDFLSLDFLLLVVISGCL
jgi:hypothetical protein